MLAKQEQEQAPVPLALRLEGDRIVMRAPRAIDIAELRSVLGRNADHLRPWSPSPPPGVNPTGFTELGRSIARQRREWKAGTAYVWVVASREPGEPIIGRVAITSVARGPWQSAQIGYWIDASYAGRRLMTEALELALEFVFERLRLHRLQAAVMPHNVPSRRLLDTHGFREEGYAQRYLRIAGAWEDHVLYALTREEWPAILRRRADLVNDVDGSAQLATGSGR